MVNKKIALGVVVLVVMAVSIFAANSSIRAQGDGADSTALAGKLDEVIKNQKKVLQGLDEIKSELNIIKIRVSQQQ